MFVKDAENRNLAMFYVSVKEYIEVEEVIVENAELNLKVGETGKIKAYVVPENAKYKELNYASDNTYSVLVNQTGEVEAQFIGQAIVTINSTDKKSVKQAKCKVNVEYNANIKTDIETSQKLSDYLDLSKYQDGTFTSNNEKVVTVDKNGNITPVSVGDASIFINSTDGKLLAMVYVNVIDYVKVSEIKLEEEIINLKVGDKHNMKYVIIPNDAKYKDVEFKSNDEYIATVDARGIISANFIGEAIVTVMTKDINNIVYNQIKVINSYTDSLEIDMNQMVNIYEKLNLTGDISNYTFETNNGNVLSIDEQTSEVTGISKGDASIFVKDNFNNMVAMVYMNVK